MNKFLLLLICTILMEGQAAYGAASSSGSSSDMPSAKKIYYGSVDFNRALPGNVSGTGQQPACLIDGIAMYAYDYGIDEANRLAKNGVLIGTDSEDSYISLEQGNILLNPDKDIIVGTGEGKIAISSGATVFVMQSVDGLVIYNLSQPNAQQVTIAIPANKKKIVLQAKHLLVITKQNSQDFEKLNVNCRAVAYSKTQPLDLHDNTVTAFLADFSIASALNTIEPLKRLTVSHNKRDRLALAKLAKNGLLTSDIMPGRTTQGDFANATDKPIEVADIGH